MMKENLFSYGTLQKTNVQLTLFGRILVGLPDVLRGYKISPVEIMDEAFLSKGEQKNQQTAIISNNNNDIIRGTVFEITTEELLHADKYEPDNYTRIKIKLQSGTEAWLYIAAGE